MSFHRFIGIDYSGAQSPESQLKGLQVYTATPGHPPLQVKPATRHWSRKAVAEWLLARINEDGPLLIGIDHGFSFPADYFRRNGIPSWPAFLERFCREWPTDQAGCHVQEFLDRMDDRSQHGSNTELRLCEQWTSSAKSVFLFNVQGSVAKSTHAGLPWLRCLRQNAGERLFFWPYDGWLPPEGKSVIAEVYPSIFRHRYPREDRTPDEHDAYAVARWLEETWRRGALERYFSPPLTPNERATAHLEGWILGIG